ncbi:histidine utilization repressor [Rhizobiaceae bacterium BDR2-2]|uniref:Histidine utilization repressor n=1 Tax=Ectorhizobium quercum TaxID=2965071 RepID=A0AAE3MZB3_9HYPH|nr:histidine utilization repressor [Ectorhizobium quercum]MCX8997226.1 histidine utilization repressor [Ectorhizobium quercum]
MASRKGRAMDERVEKTPDATLHQRILADIEGHILSGEWPPGHRIPFEHELTRQYGCSRMTVSKALGDLVRRGLIERRRRSGSFVAHPQVQSAVLQVHDIRQEVEALGLTYAWRTESRAARGARSDDRKRLDLPARARVVAITGCHYAGRQPFCHEDRLINLTAVPDAENQAFDDNVGPGTWLLQQVPWNAAENRIRAVAAEPDVAALLGIAPGTACLVIERRTWISDLHVTQVRLTYPGDRHELVAAFTPSQS